MNAPVHFTFDVVTQLDVTLLLQDAFEVDADLGVKVFISEDAKVGPRAFAENQKPVFTGQ